jgi:1-carboxybiuret hydrolase subunit AtzG-like
MKRKAARKVKSAPAAKSRAPAAKSRAPRGKRAAAKPPAKAASKKAGATPQHDAVDAMMIASAQALGLTLDPSWQAGIKFNLQLVLRHAALVDEFPLPDDAEPAPVFHA